MKKIKTGLFKLFNSASRALIKTRIHKKIPFLFSLYDSLFQRLWPHPTILEIQGSKMYINVHEGDPDMRRTFQNYAVSKVHEKATTDLFKKVVKEGDIAVDLGANIGYFTLLAAKLVGGEGKVYAFEPEPKNYNYLVRNIELNGYNNVFAFQKAVSDKNGIAKLFICPYDTGHHTINQRRGIEDYRQGRAGKVSAIDIETVTLDEFMKDKESEINVIKIDIEGAEALALSGMDRMLKENKNIKMFVEFFPLLIKKMGSSPEEFIRRLLKDYGFSIFVIGQDYNACNKELLKINSVDELMNFCKDEEDHLNLFIKKPTFRVYK